MYYYEYIRKMRKNDNDCDIFDLMNQAEDDAQVTDDELEEIYEVFKEVAYAEN